MVSIQPIVAHARGAADTSGPGPDACSRPARLGSGSDPDRPGAGPYRCAARRARRAAEDRGAHPAIRNRLRLGRAGRHAAVHAAQLHLGHGATAHHHGHCCRRQRRQFRLQLGAGVRPSGLSGPGHQRLGLRDVADLVGHAGRFRAASALRLSAAGGSVPAEPGRAVARHRRGAASRLADRRHLSGGGRVCFQCRRC